MNLSNYPRLKKEFEYVQSEMELISNGECRVMGCRTYTDKEFIKDVLEHLVDETEMAITGHVTF